MKALWVGIFLSFIFLASCTKNNGQTLFELIDANETNIHFVNTITTTNEINVIDFQYCYNGGGVGVGDFDNNGFPDLVFTGNQVSSQIYLNKGDFNFKDITSLSGFETKSWVTGVSIVDINADGWDDIYLNVGGSDCNNDCPNQLFVNQGIGKENVPIFKEEAKKYGLQEPGYAQQTAFFDYDRDGDLDAYILRNGNLGFDKNSPVPKRYFPKHLTDILLRNDTLTSTNEPFFTDVSQEMGVVHKGFGLGMGINDMNDDGWPDVYVGNDFITNDLVYINQRSISDSLGFKELAHEYLGHQTYNAMGVDITDINNDGAPDITVLDMLPDNYQRQKTMMGAMNYDKYELALRNHYNPQFMRNTMQISNGFLGKVPLRYSDVSFITETAQTDWSWSPLLADYDCDGDKDLFVTNGYGKDITDLDFINYTQQNNIFGTEESRNKKLKQLVDGLPAVQLQNFFFENTPELTFHDVTKKWVDEKISLSNGAAYADLDLDGDLDLIVNNIDQKAFILKNNRSERVDYNYLNVELKGQKTNKNAIGSKVQLWADGKFQSHYQSVIRGYLSSVEPGAFFGLKTKKIDSVKVIWPTGEISTIVNPKPNQTLIINIEKAIKRGAEKKKQNPFFEEVDSLLIVKHSENESNDYVHQNLLMTQHSKFGPCMASTKLDGFKNDILFIGGSHGIPGVLMAKEDSGKFEIIQKMDSIYEDSAALFFDFDKDGDKDLYIGSGGSEYPSGTNVYQDRMYVNNGKNHFTREQNIVPRFYSSTSCIKPMDFDKDGDQDLFVGSNIVPRRYPSAPKNRILINENGRFVEQKNDELQSLGMVKDAVWSDVDADGWEDLILVGDWMPVTIFKNERGSLVKWDAIFSDSTGKKIDTSGWWRCIETADFDKDGDADFLMGNQGKNNFINPEQTYPVYIFKADFDGNGSVDPIIGAYYPTEKGRELKPLHSRDDVMKQLVVLKNNYRSYDEFAKVGFTELLQIQDLSQETLKATISESVYVENLGDFKFKVKPLPILCQLSPINDFLVKDLDDDGNSDALLVGNDYQCETHYGRYDALTGLFLKGMKQGGFRVVPSSESGFYVPHQSNRIMQLNIDEGASVFVAAQNNDSIKVFQRNLNRIDD